MKKMMLIACFLVLVLAACGSTDTTTTGGSSSPTTQGATSAPTPTPTPHAQKWTTVQKFSGNGTKKTAIFAVPDDWKMVYTCDGGSYGSFLGATVYDNNNAYVSSGIDVQCKAGVSTKGETEEHQAGQVYLDIMGTDAWTIVVQVLK